MGDSKMSTTMPRTRYHHGNLHQSLLQAAKTLISERGLEGLSLRQLAVRCQVSQTAPYRHFASKEHLLAVLAESCCHDLLTTMKHSISGTTTPLPQQITSMLEAYINYAKQHTNDFQLIFTQKLPARCNYPSLLQMIQLPQKLITHTLEDNGYAQTVAEVKAKHIYTYAHGLAIYVLNQPVSSQNTSLIRQQLQQALALLLKT